MTSISKAGVAIAIVGSVLALLGWTQLKPYTPDQFDRSKSHVDPLFGRDDMTNWLEVQERNRARAWEAQVTSERAQPYITWGSSLALGGIVLIVLGRRAKQPATRSAGCSYCGQCGAPVGRVAYCGKCGAPMSQRDSPTE